MSIAGSTADMIVRIRFNEEQKKQSGSKRKERPVTYLKNHVINLKQVSPERAKYVRLKIRNKMKFENFVETLIGVSFLILSVVVLLHLIIF
ncbi:hypothetical protein EMN47_00710 [Prolixibacteraceae bacterium JC049]|jgi:hypothetical protein|nr:hypothetical protein [Prolixibacteraceae bacterium JC049]